MMIINLIWITSKCNMRLSHHAFVSWTNLDQPTVCVCVCGGAGGDDCAQLWHCGRCQVCSSPLPIPFSAPSWWPSPTHTHTPRSCQERQQTVIVALTGTAWIACMWKCTRLTSYLRVCVLQHMYVRQLPSPAWIKCLLTGSYLAMPAAHLVMIFSLKLGNKDKSFCF